MVMVRDQEPEATATSGGGGNEPSGGRGGGRSALRGMSYDEQVAAVTPSGGAAGAPTFERWVQRGLNDALGESLAETGVLDRATRVVARTFQRKRRLQVDGIVGPRTTTALEEATATTAPTTREADAPAPTVEPEVEEADEPRVEDGPTAVNAAAEAGPAQAAPTRGPGGEVAAPQVEEEEARPSAPLPRGLTDERIAAAIAWGAKQGYAPEAVAALQAKLGAPATGEYDRETAVAVFRIQSNDGKNPNPKTPGKATVSFFHKRGLIAFKATSAVDAPDLEALKAAHPNGFPLGVWAEYKTKSGDNAEIQKRAVDWGKDFNAVGVAGGVAAMGVVTPIKYIEEVVQVIQQVSASLIAKWKATDPRNADGSPATEPPSYLKIRNLGLFAHGMEYGLSLHEGGSYKDGLQSGTGGNASNIEAFVKAISGATTKDVSVQLFACNAGLDVEMLREQTKKKGDKKAGREATSYRQWVNHNENERRGDGSFADQLNEALEADGKESTVYAHTTAGHTHENFAARAFGKAAEHVQDDKREGDEGGGGAHMFDVLYPTSFVDDQLASWCPKLTADHADGAKARHALRERMWAHYKDSISAEHKRKGGDKRYSEPIGRLMFMDPAAASAALHEDLKTWLPANAGDFGVYLKRHGS